MSQLACHRIELVPPALHSEYCYNEIGAELNFLVNVERDPYISQLGSDKSQDCLDSRHPPPPLFPQPSAIDLLA